MRDVLRDGARVHGRRLAVVDGDTALTYRELHERACRLANAWRSLGIGRGDRIAMISGNSHRFFEWYFACTESGVIGAPLHFRLHPDELARYVEYIEPAALVVDSNFADLARATLASVDVQTVIGFGPGHGFELDYESLLDGASSAPIDEACDPTAPSIISPTSGTTGSVKGAVLSQQNTFMACMAFLTGIGYTPTTRRLQSVQLSFATAGPHYAPLFLGATMDVVPRFEPELFAESVERHRVTHTTLPPTMVYDLLDAGIDPKRLATLEVLNVGGAPLDASRFREAIEYLGPILHVTYGMTETAACATMLRPSDYGDATATDERLSAVGRPWPGVRLRLVSEAGETVGPGEQGEIEVSGPTVGQGYWRMPKETADSIVEGWFRTGDIGVLDDDGVLSVVDRRKDLIVSGGINIASLEVENVLSRHPAVDRVAVIGVPHPRWGEAVAAIVVPRSGASATERDLVDWCDAHLASFKKPRRVEFVEALPVNANGKVLKRELRERFGTR